jgi:hypothetical protein
MQTWKQGKQKSAEMQNSVEVKLLPVLSQRAPREGGSQFAVQLNRII